MWIKRSHCTRYTMLVRRTHIANCWECWWQQYDALSVCFLSLNYDVLFPERMECIVSSLCNCVVSQSRISLRAPWCTRTACRTPTRTAWRCSILQKATRFPPLRRYVPPASRLPTFSPHDDSGKLAPNRFPPQLLWITTDVWTASPAGYPKCKMYAYNKSCDGARQGGGRLGRVPLPLPSSPPSLPSSAVHVCSSELDVKLCVLPNSRRLAVTEGLTDGSQRRRRPERWAAAPSVSLLCLPLRSLQPQRRLRSLRVVWACVVMVTINAYWLLPPAAPLSWAVVVASSRCRGRCAGRAANISWVSYTVLSSPSLQPPRSCVAAAST